MKTDIKKSPEREWGDAVAGVSGWFLKKFPDGLIPDGVYDVPGGAEAHMANNRGAKR
jgi:hypothetical protein